MPINQPAYNSRVTDEKLEKKFRDAFKSQGGAELVDDLYASGVIVPVVDFSQAAEGSGLPINLQLAWDFSTGSTAVTNTTTTLISNPGFWQIDLNCTADLTGGSISPLARIYLDDGVSQKNVWGIHQLSVAASTDVVQVEENQFIVFLRAGDTLKVQSYATTSVVDIWYRQVADVNGNLKDPLGFSPS